jgi:hypothetical protein
VAPFATVRSRKSGHFPEDRTFHLLNHKLGNPITSSELDRMLGVCVQQNHLDLATVPRVNCARRIDDRYAVLGRQARARMYKRGVPIWQRDAHASADHCSLARAQVDVRGSEQVTARVARVRTLRQREIWVEASDQDIDRSGLCARAGHL